MKNKLSKIILLAMVFCIVISLVGCSNSAKQIEKLTDSLFDGIQAFDSRQIKNCFVSSDNSDDIIPNSSNQDSDFFTQNVLNYLRESASLTSHSITNIVENKDTATVYLSVSYLDAGPIMTSSMGEYFVQALPLAFGGASETELQNLFTTIFMEKTKSVQLSMVKTDIVLDCVKTNNGWKFNKMSDETSEKMLNVVTCGLLNALNSFDSESAWDESENEETYSEPTVFHDIPLGQDAEFATIKVRVNKCYENSKLSKAYWGELKAVDGTKFVLFEVTIENITKQTLNFTNGFILIDSQERSFKTHSDALWYFDETFTYVDLSPNVPVNGVLVFNVPNDATDYYLYGIHADTNEGFKLFGK